MNGVTTATTVTITTITTTATSTTATTTATNTTAATKATSYVVTVVPVSHCFAQRVFDGLNSRSCFRPSMGEQPRSHRLRFILCAYFL
jgi:hypothetical protein